MLFDFFHKIQWVPIEYISKNNDKKVEMDIKTDEDGAVTTVKNGNAVNVGDSQQPVPFGFPITFSQTTLVCTACAMIALIENVRRFL